MTPRRRKPGREWMPEHVRHYRGRYDYVMGTAKARTVHLLVRSDVPPEQAGPALRRKVLQAAAALESRREKPKRDVAALVDAYRQSPRWRELATSTQRDYDGCYAVCLPVLGHIRVERLTPGQLTRYMDWRGEQSRVRANHELAAISAAYAWGVARDWCPSNPAGAVRKFSIARRQRYVTDAEFWSCHDSAPPVIQVAMVLALVTGLRLSDLLSLRLSAATDDGLLVATSKTGERLLFGWTPRLRAAVDACAAIPARPDICPWLLPTRSGDRYTRDGFQSIWQRHQRDWSKSTGHERFRWHDIRAKSATDHATGEHLGHRRTDVLQMHYRNRLPKRVEPLE